jgi:hypothetical protein
MAGQMGGGLIFAIGIVLMFTQKNGLYFLGAFAIFWAINYPLIHVFIGNRVANCEPSGFEDT